MSKEKAKENPTGQNKNTGNANPEILSADAEAAKKAQETASGKKEVRGVATREASEIKREVLQGQISPDKETADKIAKLDPDGGLESKEQKEGLELLQAVALSGLLAMILDQGIEKNELKSLENVKNIKASVYEKLNPTEKISLKKIQEIASKPGSKLHEALKTKWGTIVDRSYETYETAKKTKERLESQSQQSASTKTEGKREEKKEEQGFVGKIFDWVKENPYLAAGVAVAGAYGIHKIFKWVSGGENEEDSGSLGNILGKKFKTLLGVGLEVFILGRLIGNEDVRKWVKDKLGINISANRLSQFVILLSHGEVINAFKVLYEGPDENLNLHKSMAEKISKEMTSEVKPETLKKIGNMKYSDFMSDLAKGKTAAAALTGQLKDVVGDVPLAGAVIGDGEQAKQEETVRAYFEKHREAIDKMKNSDTTIDQILIVLNGGESGTEVPQPSAESQAIISAVDKIEDPEKKAQTQKMSEELRQKLIPEETVKAMVVLAQKKGIKTEKIPQLLEKRNKAFNEYLETLSTGDIAKIADKSEKLADADNVLRNEMTKLDDEIGKRHGWTELETLGLTHALKFWRFFRQPAYKKEYGKYLLVKYAKKPFELAGKGIDKITGRTSEELIGKEFKANANLERIEADLAKTTEERKEAEILLEDVKKQEITKTKTADEIKAEVNHAESKVNLLKKDEEIHAIRKKIAEKEAHLVELKTQDAAAAKSEIAAAEKIIEENKAQLRSLMKDRVKLQGGYLKHEMAETAAVIKRELGEDGKKAILSKGYIDQMDQLQNAVEKHRTQILEQRNALLKEADEVRKIGRPFKTIVGEINELNEELVRFEVGSLKNADTLAKSWWKSWDLYQAMKGGNVSKEAHDVMEAEKNQIQRLFAKITKGQQEASPGAKQVLVTSLKGKVFVHGAFFIAAGAINLADRKEGEEVHKIIGQTAADTLPFVSTFSDFYSAGTGREMVTGRTMEAKDRALRAVFGIGSGLCDLTELAGVFMGLRRAAGAMKEAKAVGKGVELAEVMKTMRTGKSDAEQIEAIREMAATGHWGIKMGMAGALGVAGYELVIKPVAEVELSAETKKVLGDQLQDIDIQGPNLGQPTQPLKKAA